MASIIILFISVLIASGLCSMYEAALLSVSPIKVRGLYEDRKSGAADLFAVKNNIHFYIATIVVFNNAINICGSIFIGQMVTKFFGDNWLGVSSAFLTFSIIIISEIIPKSFGEHHRISVSLAGAKVVRTLGFVFRPLITFLMYIVKFIPKKGQGTSITEKDITTMLKMAQETGAVEPDEEKLCRMVFRLNDLKARDMMKPIAELVGFYAHKRLGSIKDSIVNCRYSRLAVFGKSKEDVQGICQHKDLLVAISRDDEDSAVGAFAKPPIFVYDYEKADDILYKFQMYHQHLFIVRNVMGNNIGVITMEDILEELFGEIYDEKDISLFKKRQTKNNSA